MVLKTTTLFAFITTYLLISMVNSMVTLAKSSQTSSQSVNGHSSVAKSPNVDVGINRMVWVDMEMTGLEIETQTILEVACIITDENLNIVAEGPDLIIHQSQTVLDNMEEWSRVQHKKTGLTEESERSNLNITEAENKLLEFVSKHVAEKVSPLAGSSVYMDRLFMKKYMPRLDAYLHYRLIDVSTIKELCKRWNPNVCRSAPQKKLTHRALGDIKESIEELKYYKNNFFRLD